MPNRSVTARAQKEQHAPRRRSRPWDASRRSFVRRCSPCRGPPGTRLAPVASPLGAARGKPRAGLRRWRWRRQCYAHAREKFAASHAPPSARIERALASRAKPNPQQRCSRRAHRVRGDLRARTGVNRADRSIAPSLFNITPRASRAERLARADALTRSVHSRRENRALCLAPTAPRATPKARAMSASRAHRADVRRKVCALVASPPA